jgi:hypothetical protein
MVGIQRANVKNKPNLRKYNDTQNLQQQDQVVVSRIRMSYMRLTEVYRLDNSPQPQCQISQTSIFVPYIQWECSNRHQVTQHEIVQGILKANEEKATLEKYRSVLRNLKETYIA